MTKGVFFCIMTVTFWALEYIAMKLIVSNWSIQPAIFVCVNLLCAAIVLLIVAGPGRLGLETIKQPHTWAYSLLNVLNNVFFVLTVGLISATEAAFVWRLSAVITLFVVWFFVGRRLPWTDWLGGLGVLLGCLIIMNGFDPMIQSLAIGIVLMGTISRTLLTTVIEFHPTSNQSRTIKEQCRTTGYVLIVTSATFLVAILGIASVAESYADRNDLFGLLARLMPATADFFDPATIWSAMAMGGILTSIYSYSQFVAARVAKSEVLMMASIFVPVITFGFEYIAQFAGYLTVSEIAPRTLAAGALIVASAVFMVFMRFRASRRDSVAPAV
ncbi:MAG: EamA family transporter [Pontimonas sp.]